MAKLRQVLVTVLRSCWGWVEEIGGVLVEIMETGCVCGLLSCKPFSSLMPAGLCQHFNFMLPSGRGELHPHVIVCREQVLHLLTSSEVALGFPLMYLGICVLCAAVFHWMPFQVKPSPGAIHKKTLY